MISTGRRDPLEPITTSELLNGSEKWTAQIAWLRSPPCSVRAGDALWEVRRAACAREMPYGKSAAQCACWISHVAPATKPFGTVPRQKIRAKRQKFFDAQRVGLIEPIAPTKFSVVHFSFSSLL